MVMNGAVRRGFGADVRATRLGYVRGSSEDRGAQPEIFHSTASLAALCCYLSISGGVRTRSCRVLSKFGISTGSLTSL
jgi:hypothetical protein